MFYLIKLKLIFLLFISILITYFILDSMPVCTRSVNNFATNIVNNILENAFNRCSCNNPENINDVDNVHAVAAVVDADLASSESAECRLGCCSVCLDEIQSEKGRFVLECGHTFHAKCILLEFRHRNRCPMCRTEVAESAAHRFMMPSTLRIYSSILHDAADHFIHDLGNITFANVIHRMMLLSSEDQELRSIQYPYIKRLLVQFASMLIRGVAFSVRDHDHDSEIQDPVPIDIVDNMMDVDNDSDYDAAISNPAVDAAVAYQAIVTTDMNFDSPSHNDNVSSALIRRSVALAAMGSQRADLSLRRASRIALRHQQFQDVQRLLQEAVVEREQQAEADIAHSPNGQNQGNQGNQGNQSQSGQNVNMVISENQNPVEENDDDEPNPWGIQF